MELVEGKQKLPNSSKRNKDGNKNHLIKVYLKNSNSGTDANKSSIPASEKIRDSDFDIIEMKYSLPYIPNDYYDWHKNKQKAWKLIPSCPSLYYFFYLAPGLHEATYPPKEKDFIESLRVYPPQLNGWGLFSLHLPGYTGKQCYEYYMTLLSEKKVSGKYKSLPVFQKTDVLTYYTSYINACKSYTATVKEEHNHHKAPAYNRHNNNEKHKTDKHKHDKEEDDDEEEDADEDDDDEVIEKRKTKKNKKNKNEKKKKPNKTSKKTKKSSRSYNKYIVDDLPEELSLSEEDEEESDSEESELFSITTNETSHEEDDDEDSDDVDSDEDSVIKLVRKKPKKTSNNSNNIVDSTPKSEKKKSAKIETTPPTTVKSIESTPSSSISIRNEVDSSPFQSPPSSNIISVKTTPETSDIRKNESFEEEEEEMENENVSEVHTPNTNRSVDETPITPPPVVKRSSYYQQTAVVTKKNILDSPISDDNIEGNEVNVNTPVVEEIKKIEEEKTVIKEKKIVKRVVVRENIKPTKTIVIRKRKLENITGGYSNKKQKNLISLLSRDYSILPEIKIPSCEDNNIPYEFKVLKYRCEVEFRRLTQTIINSIEVLRREYNDVSIEGNKKNEDRMYKYVVDELKCLENKYNEGIIEIQRRYNAEYCIIKSLLKQKEFNDENILRNTFINPFYM